MLGWPSIVKYIAIAAMIFGMLVIVLTGGRAEKTKGAQIGQGLYSLYGITSYIGDLVSYTRLMALRIIRWMYCRSIKLINEIINWSSNNIITISCL